MISTTLLRNYVGKGQQKCTVDITDIPPKDFLLTAYDFYL